MLECAPTRMNDEPCTQIIVRASDPGRKAPTTSNWKICSSNDDVTGLYSRFVFPRNLRSTTTAPYCTCCSPITPPFVTPAGFEAIEQFMLGSRQPVQGNASQSRTLPPISPAAFTIYDRRGRPPMPWHWPRRSARRSANTVFRSTALFTTTCRIGVCQAQESHERGPDSGACRPCSARPPARKAVIRSKSAKPPKEERQARHQ